MADSTPETTLRRSKRKRDLNSNTYAPDATQQKRSKRNSDHELPLKFTAFETSPTSEFHPLVESPAKGSAKDGTSGTPKQTRADRTVSSCKKATSPASPEVKSQSATSKSTGKTKMSKDQPEKAKYVEIAVSESRKKERSNGKPNGSRQLAIFRHVSHTEPLSVELDWKPQPLLEDGRNGAQTESWKVAGPAGGTWLQYPPLFSSDDEFFMVAVRNTLHIYSATTSLLAHIFDAPASSKISAFATSKTKSQYVYIATTEGTIFVWNWKENVCVKKLETTHPIFAIAVTKDQRTGNDLVFMSTYELLTSAISVCSVHPTMSEGESSLTQLLQTDAPITLLQADEESNCVILAVGSEVIIGKIPESGSSQQDFVWRQFNCHERVVSLDIQVPPPGVAQSAKSAKKPDEKSSTGLNLVVGTAPGVIFVYDNLLSHLEQLERHEPIANFQPRRLHWHRDAVKSVRWSRDGNYVISGGSETVLVLWQLDTGRKQYLPHMMAAIQSLTVSNSGRNYGIMLSDQTVIILSTSELKPVATVTGLQALSQRRRQAEAGSAGLVGRNEMAMTLHPRRPEQLLLAVPSDFEEGTAMQSTKNAPYLQTFDFKNHRSLSRQALARTNATHFNKGPEHNKILGAHVELVSISHDGRWLATVDEWTEPSEDQQHLHSSDRTIAEREIFLKFWRYNDKASMWELTTRIDAPHGIKDGRMANRVLDLATNFARPGFATIGEDSKVRLWSGMKSASNQTWFAKRTIQLEPSKTSYDLDTTPFQHSGPTRGCVSYSLDASLVAVCYTTYQPTKQSLTSVINCETGHIQNLQQSLSKGNAIASKLCKQYLITLSRNIMVWDLVQNQLVFGCTLKIPSSYDTRARGLLQLATNDNSSTFAVSVPTTQETGAAGSEIMIFHPPEPQPIWVRVFPCAVVQLMAVTSAMGYVAIDADAGVWSVGPPGDIAATLARPLSIDMDESLVDEEVADLLDDDEAMDRTDGMPGIAFVDDVPRPVVRQDKLAEALFPQAGSQLLPTSQLFHRVAELYAKKPAVH